MLFSFYNRAVIIKTGGIKMLKSFSVSNFKQFKNVSIDFTDVRDYKFSNECIKDGFIKNAVIYGKNSSGKTNLGLAIMDIVNHLTDKEKRPYLYQYYLNADNACEPATFRYEFLFDGVKIVYAYKKIDMGILTQEMLSIDGKIIFDFDFRTQMFIEQHFDFFGIFNINWMMRFREMSVLRFLAYNTEFSNFFPLQKLIIFVNRMLWFRRLDDANNFIGFRNFNGTGDFIKDIINNNLVDELQVFLNEAGVNEKIAVKRSADGSLGLYFIHRDRALPFDTSSSGTKTLVLFFAWYKQFQDVSFVIIDEFDAFYHYALSEKIVKLLMDKVQSQVLLTSHNTNLLSNRIMRPDCYFILNEDGLKSFANATKRELREGNNLEKLFIGGEFGE